MAEIPPSASLQDGSETSFPASSTPDNISIDLIDEDNTLKPSSDDQTDEICTSPDAPPSTTGHLLFSSDLSQAEVSNEHMEQEEHITRLTQEQEGPSNIVEVTEPYNVFSEPAGVKENDISQGLQVELHTDKPTPCDTQTENAASVDSVETPGVSNKVDDQIQKEETPPSISSYFMSTPASSDAFASMVEETVPSLESSSHDQLSDSLSTYNDVVVTGNVFVLSEQCLQSNTEPVMAALTETIAPEASAASITKENVSFFSGEKENEGFLSSSEFSLPLHDMDRSYDAWLPSAATKDVLIQMQKGGGSSVPANVLTFPGIARSEPLGDPISGAVFRLIGEAEMQKRKVVTASSVSCDFSGLRELIKGKYWRAAVDLTGTLLTRHGQGVGKAGTSSSNTPDSIKLWACRFSLLVKLKMYTEAEQEMRAFGNLDSPDLYYGYHQGRYPGKRGSLVPFEMRLLHAVLPSLADRRRDSVDRLFHIKSTITKIMDNLNNDLPEDGGIVILSAESRKASIAIWEKRLVKTLYTIAGCLNDLRDYQMTCRVYEMIIERTPEDTPFVLCSIGRVHLQIGNVDTAACYFEKAQETFTDGPTKEFYRAMNRGYLNIGRNQYAEASRNFTEAHTVTGAVEVIARCNRAVSSLYEGSLKAGLIDLEELVYSNPPVYLQPSLLINLCTLYEMESSQAKKLDLLTLVAREKGDSFDLTSLKLG